ncbi:hypothetical protein JTB14_033371 [Gonioctena quinquepunctata]|nr:hypothetical protein JTB14_033371 [Gonioctena quinquepunctata]
MMLMETYFVLLTAIVSNVLYVNVPKRVKYMAICTKNFKPTCNRTEWKLKRLVTINDGQLPVFAVDLRKNTFKYKLELIFEDGRERDTENWEMGHHKAEEHFKVKLKNMNLQALNNCSLIAERSNCINVRNLPKDIPQPIEGGRIVKTKFGERVILDLEGDQVVFLSQRVTETYRSYIEHFSTKKYHLVFRGCIDTGKQNNSRKKDEYIAGRRGVTLEELSMKTICENVSCIADFLRVEEEDSLIPWKMKKEITRNIANNKWKYLCKMTQNYR